MYPLKNDGAPLCLDENPSNLFVGDIEWSIHFSETETCRKKMMDFENILHAWLTNKVSDHVGTHDSASVRFNKHRSMPVMHDQERRKKRKR
jgi:hypothetical protein